MEPTFNPLHTKKQGKRRKRGVGMGGAVGERVHQDPTTLDCQLVERWRRDESESPMSPSSPSQLEGLLCSLLWP